MSVAAFPFMGVRARSRIDAADALATLRPALIEHAARKLRRMGLDWQQSEDLVQDAALRLLQTKRRLRTLADFRRYSKAVISNLAYDAARRRKDPKDQRREKRDLMDLDPLSLDTPWARGG